MAFTCSVTICRSCVGRQDAHLDEQLAVALALRRRRSGSTDARSSPDEMSALFFRYAPSESLQVRRRREDHVPAQEVDLLDDVARRGRDDPRDAVDVDRPEDLRKRLLREVARVLKRGFRHVWRILLTDARSAPC